MSIKQEFKRALIRRLAYIAAAFLIAAVMSMMGIGKAHAQNFGNCESLAPSDNGALCPSKAAALAASQASLALYIGGTCEAGSIQSGNTQNGIPYIGQWRVCDGLNNTFFHRTYVIPTCVEPEWWNDELQKCDRPCAERNADLGGVNQRDRSRGWGQGASDECIAGCKYRLVSGERTETAKFSIGGAQPVEHTQIWGKWEYTGDFCEAPSLPRDDEKPQTNCSPAVEGVKVCTSPEGDNCMTSSTGRFICWAKNESGTKTDGPITQTKSPGIQPPASIEGSSSTSTTNITNTTNNNSTTTTINNYSTNNGSPAGPNNQGTGTNGSGKPNSTSSGGGTGGAGDGDNDTASGGNGCESPPVSSGNAILGAILQQTYATRCEIAKGLGSLKGEGECSAQGTVVAFNCSGDTVGCALALKARERGCKEAQANQQLIGDGAKDQGNEPDGELWGTGDTPGTLNAGLISLGGGQLIGTIEIEGQSVNLDEKIAPGVAAARMLIIAACMVLAAFIAGGRP